MSLLDDVRQTINDVTENVVERSQHLSTQTRLQVSIKKLQLERAKRIHELGTKTFDWYQSGNLTVGGPVPQDVAGMCQELAGIQHQLDEAQHQLEEVKRLAEEARLQAADPQDPLPPTATTTTPTTYSTPPPPPSPSPTPSAGPTAPASTMPGSGPTYRSSSSSTDKSTVVLKDDNAGPIPMPPAHGGQPDVMRP